MSKDIKAVILAAGLGTRMKSDIPKVLHPLAGRPMIEYVLEAVRSSGIDDIICVISHKQEALEEGLKGIKSVKQRRLLGSADALKETKPLFKDFKGDILVLCGDNALVKDETLRDLVERHRENGNFCTLLTAYMTNPTGYGRIIRGDNRRVEKIVEEIEASAIEKAIEEINTGIYCFKSDNLFLLLEGIRNDNKKREYFLTDLVSLMHKKNLKVDSLTTDDSDEALGINTRRDLASAEKILKKRVCEDLMDRGVTIVDPSSTFIDKDVNIGRDTIIYPHTIIERDVKIGISCRIGPFARIRPGCELKDKVIIGNFVELVRARIDSRTKISHHAYLGDAVVGKDVNIGAGTITANYDGKAKYQTTIDDGAFIGCGTILVAPVKVGKYAVTGAGSVITRNHDVPPNTTVAGVPARILKKRSKT